MFHDDFALERELREGFALLDPPSAHRHEAVIVAWRLAREAAYQRGLFSLPSDRLGDLGRLVPSPWTTLFTYERAPELVGLRAFLDEAPVTLLPIEAPEAAPYLEALAARVGVLAGPSGRIGFAFLGATRIAPDELVECEERLLTQFARDAAAEGLQEAKTRARFAHGFSERELIQLLAMHCAAQAQALSAIDDKQLVRMQVLELDRLAARMASGIEPDLRGAAMARREIARLSGADPTGAGGATGDTYPVAPLARIAEENSERLPARLTPVRADVPPEKAAE